MASKKAKKVTASDVLNEQIWEAFEATLDSTAFNEQVEELTDEDFEQMKEDGLDDAEIEEYMENYEKINLSTLAALVLKRLLASHPDSPFASTDRLYQLSHVLVMIADQTNDFIGVLTDNNYIDVRGNLQDALDDWETFKTPGEL